MNRFDPQKLSDVILRAQEAFNTPAISAAVSLHDEVIFAKGFGTRTLGRAERVDENTSYAIASMSKSFTAAAMMMLVDEGKVKLDDPVRKYLPDFALKDAFANQEMRIRDLMIHDSGLNSECGGTIWYGSDYSREEVIRRLRFLRPVTGFRSCFAYQNVFFLVAGEVVRAVSGMSWDDFVSQRILQPLQMSRTVTGYAALKACGMDNIATPHVMIGDTLRIIHYRDHDNCGPAASMHSTASDLLKWLGLYLRGGICPNGRLLSESAVQQIQRGQICSTADDVPEKAVHPRLDCRFPMYGYGWRVQDYGAYKEVAHSGGVDGMRGRIALFPEKDFAAAVLSNSEDRRAYMSVLLTIYDMLLENEPLDWVEIYRGQAADTSHPQRVIEKETAQKRSDSAYCGRYLDSVYGEIMVENESDGLMLRFSHTAAFSARLNPCGEDWFQLLWLEEYIPSGHVHFSFEGLTCTGLHLDQPRLLDVDFTELDPLIRRIS